MLSCGKPFPGGSKAQARDSRRHLLSPTMMQSRLSLLLVACVFAACAQQPVKDEAQPDLDREAQAQAQTKPKPRVVVAKPAASSAPLPSVELTEQLLLKVMVAEVALQRGQPQIAVPAYLELARETRDPRIAQRATEIAWNARFVAAALEAAGIWLQVDPGSTQARQIIASLLVNQAQLGEAQPHLEKWLASDRANAGSNFLQLNALLARHKDKPAVAKLVQALAKPYADVPEARLATAQAAWNADDQKLALDEARAALKLKPDWDVAALFVAQVLQSRSP